ncbi:hypothetical protein JM658_10915 [Joostella atrarenae]|uniref:Lipoprotein n=1 Tax=Joostella atrarenae TaxID=679257 RepID=A0ABS9J4L3_9FLAO|nr:hypothetical protein [Joostella atrarenae]MCF8715339.1 hypothetical protein [Joostella atrarenae]
MKKGNLYAYILIYLFITSCETSKVPESLSNTTWQFIEYKEEKKYRPCMKSFLNFEIKNDSLYFYRMSVEVEKIKKIEEITDGFIISFEDFTENVEYRLYWIDEEKRIILWEYYNLDDEKVNPDFSFYTIDNKNYDSLPKEQCNDSRIKEKSSPLGLNDNWKTNCDDLGILKINNENIFIEVNSNQIYVDGELRKENDSIYHIYLNKPNDLGAGGARLNWGSFSKDSIIGVISYNNVSDIINFNWLGFYNTETHHRDWTENSDFQLQSEKLKDIKLIRCK